MPFSKPPDVIPPEIQKMLLKAAGIDSSLEIPPEAQLGIMSFLEVMKKASAYPKSKRLELVRAYIDANRRCEVIDVEGLGRVNVSGVNAMISALNSNTLLYHQDFSEMGLAGGLNIEEFLKDVEEDIDNSYSDKLTDQRLKDPVIFLVKQSGVSVLLDGKHRLRARFKRGFADFSYYQLDERSVRGWIEPPDVENAQGAIFDKYKVQIELMLVLETMAIRKTVPYANRFILTE